MIDRYQFEERVAICLVDDVPIKIAEEIAARQFFGSCNLPTKEDIGDAQRLGWSIMKLFRMMNREGLRRWNQSR